MKNKSMLLNSTMIASITGGKWINLTQEILFHGVRVNINRIEKNDLCFTSNPEQWGKNISNTENKLNIIFNNGAKAAVLTNENIAKASKYPILLVKNSKKALEDLAFYARDNINVKRILVTGTEGKTGFKNQLYFLLNHQTNSHATLDSSNLNVPILCSMASITVDDKVEIIEASVAEPNVGVIRSNLVKPDICVITEVGFEHIASHGSFENLIDNKASIIDGLKQDGICVLNADSINYDLIREAIYKRKYVKIVTFGSNKKCNARLIDAKFNTKKLVWNIKSSIYGIEISYSVPLLGEHIPLSSLAPLLVIHLLGYDVKKAAKDYMKFIGTETMGILSEIKTSEITFYFYDHSHRASILSYDSALKDLSRIFQPKNGRKIAVIGNMLNIGNISKKAHEDLAELIEKANVNRLYTVGVFAKPIHDKLKDKTILIKHADKYTEIEKDILADIQDGDLIFVKGHHRIWLKELADKIYSLGVRGEIR